MCSLIKRLVVYVKGPAHGVAGVTGVTGVAACCVTAATVCHYGMFPKMVGSTSLQCFLT